LESTASTLNTIVKSRNEIEKSFLMKTVFWKQKELETLAPVRTGVFVSGVIQTNQN
jgi:hypothetical protein